MSGKLFEIRSATNVPPATGCSIWEESHRRKRLSFYQSICCPCHSSIHKHYITMRVVSLFMNLRVEMAMVITGRSGWPLKQDCVSLCLSVVGANNHNTVVFAVNSLALSMLLCGEESCPSNKASDFIQKWLGCLWSRLLMSAYVLIKHMSLIWTKMFHHIFVTCIRDE